MKRRSRTTLLLVAGLFSLLSIRIEGFPALAPSSVTVTVTTGGNPRFAHPTRTWHTFLQPI